MDPDLADPGNFSKWRLRTTPRGLQMIGTIPFTSIVVVFVICIVAVVAIWVLYFAGVIVHLGDAIMYSIVPGIGVAGVGYGLRIRMSQMDRKDIVLDYDAHAGKLLVHGEEIEPEHIEAVERIGISVGMMASYHEGSRRGRGGSYTSRVHLVLRERLYDRSAQHPTSNEPGIRFRAIACTSVGLRGFGRKIADRLGVPYRKTHLGVHSVDAGFIDLNDPEQREKSVRQAIERRY